MEFAATRHDDSSTAYVQWARRLVAGGRIAEAKLELRRGMASSPCREAALLLTRVLVAHNELELGREVLASWVASYPDPGVCGVLVRLHQALGDLPGASRSAEAGLVRFPDDPQLRSLAAQCDAAANNSLEAVEAIDSETCAIVSVQSRISPESVVSSIVDLTQDLEAVEDESSHELVRVTLKHRAPARERPIAAAQISRRPPPTPPRRSVELSRRSVESSRAGELEELDTEVAPTTVHPNNPIFGPLLGAGAPNLEVAVQRYARAASTQRPSGAPLFSALLGDGPPASRQRPRAVPPPLPGASPVAPGARVREPVQEDAADDERETLPVVLGSAVALGTGIPAPAPLPALRDEEERATANWSPRAQVREVALGGRSAPSSESLTDERHRPVLEPTERSSSGTGVPAAELSASALIREPPRLAANDRDHEGAEPTAAATPAAKEGRRPSRPSTGPVNALDAEDQEEVSFRRPGEGVPAEDSDEILAGPGQLPRGLLPSEELASIEDGVSTPRVLVIGPDGPAAGFGFAKEPRDAFDPTGEATPPETEDYPSAELRRISQTGEVRNQLSAPGSRRPTPPAALAASLSGEVTPPSTPRQRARSGSTPTAGRAAMPPLPGSRRALTGPPLSTLELASAGPPRSPTRVPTPVLVSTSAQERAQNAAEASRGDFFPVAPVKVSRPGEPTADGFRLSLDGRASDEVGGRVARPFERRRATAQLRGRTPARGRRANDMAPAVRPEPAQPQARRRLTRAWRPARAVGWGALTVIVAFGTLGGFWFQRQRQGQHHLVLARKLAGGWDLAGLRGALEQARRSAARGMRSAEVVAFAAAIHARLAVELGESTIAGVAALVEESKRLGAPYSKPASDDLRVAEAYLHFARKPLPQTIFYLEEQQDLAANGWIERLRALALLRAGDHRRAATLIAKLPEDTASLGLRALGLGAAGRYAEARSALQAGQRGALAKDQLELLDARLAVLGGLGQMALWERELLRLSQSPALGTAERAWAWLLATRAARLSRASAHPPDFLQRALATPPLADPDFHGIAAAELMARGELDAAERQIGLATRLAPQHPGHRRMRARVAMVRGQPGRCIEILGDHPNPSASDGLLLVRAHLLKGDLAQARRLLLTLPDTPESKLLTARLHLAEGSPERAYRQIKPLVPLAGSCAEPCIVAARVALTRHKSERARQLLERAVASAPHAHEALMLLGSLYRASGDRRRGRAFLERAVAANRFGVEARRELGGLLVDSGEFSPAAQQFDAVLQQRPGDLFALAGRARVRVELQLSSAEQDLLRLELLGSSAEARLLRFRREVLRRANRKALALWRALPARARGPRARLWRAQLALRIGDTRLARALLKELEDNPELRPWVLISQSQLALVDRALIRALAKARQAMALLAGERVFPQGLRIQAGLQLARCHRDLEETGAAIAELQEVLALQPKCGRAQGELGAVYLDLKKYALAAKHLEAAEGLLEPHDPRLKKVRALHERACRGLAGSGRACGAAPEQRRAPAL